jgi:septum site-determining protein MinC
MDTDKNLIQLKADLMPLTVLKINHSNLIKIRSELDNKIKQAPQYFKNAPIVIDVQAINEKEELNLSELCETLRSCNMLPVGIRGLSNKLQDSAIEQGLAIIQSNGSKKADTSTKNSAASKPTTKKPYKLITKPVRSGTQVYAKDCDLVIIASVNTGAEVIADGNIHIYGPLRGRALAGARGDESARIFCHSLEAELISIAGHYLVKENIKIPRTKKPLLQVYLNNNTITIEGI